MQLTPSIFAYSMLYPYSDNYLDDPSVSREAKLSFSVRFGRRLAGDAVASANPLEATIWRLIERMLHIIQRYQDRIAPESIDPTILWRPPTHARLTS